MPTHCWLSARQFARLQPLRPTTGRGGPRVADRRGISGLIPVFQSGWRGRAAPPGSGPSKTLDTRFGRWARQGGGEQVWAELAAAGGPPVALRLESTPGQVQRAAAGGNGGRAPKRLTGLGAAARPKARRPSLRAGAPGAGSSARVPKALCPSQRPASPSWRPSAAWPIPPPTVIPSGRGWGSGAASPASPPRPASAGIPSSRWPIRSALAWSAPSAASKTGGAGPPATTNWPGTTAPPSPSPLFSSPGDESRP